jgi:hypothetical protein
MKLHGHENTFKVLTPFFYIASFQPYSGNMDPELVVQTLNFHGQQLTKLWENERGAASLQVASLRDLDYQVYQKRSKDLGYN